jgi:hypothetical protein
MEEYLVSARTLLGVLGHRVLEPLVTVSKPVPSEVSIQPQGSPKGTVVVATEATLPSPPSPTFKLHISDLNAFATRTDEGLVVRAESEAAATALGSLSFGYRVLRDKLIQSGVLASSGSKLKFTRDHLFNSPSQAAAVLVGYSINGRDAWILPDGTTYAAYEGCLTETILKELSETQ